MRFIFTFALFVIFHKSFNQNLVPNPSFEKSTYCVWETWGDTTSLGADHWKSYRGSTDYLSKCNSWRWTNVFGYQQAYSGDAFAGFYAYIEPNDGREILGTKLLAPMIKGRNYEVSIKVSLASGYVDSGCNNVGVLFLTKGYYSTTYMSIPCAKCLGYLPNYAHVYSESVIKDYGWTEIKGNFTADSSYTHIAIGNFFDNKRTTLEIASPYNEGKRYAYYYIDDVSVEDSDTSSETNDFEFFIELPNVFTPNEDGFNDVFEPIKSQGIMEVKTTIYNRWGQSIFESKELGIEWDGRIDAKNVASTGSYFWIINYADQKGTKHVKKGWLSLVR